MVVAHLEEEDGARFRAIWFNQAWRVGQLAAGREVVLFGSFRIAPDGVVETVQPDLEAAEGWRPDVVPVYAPIAGIGPRLRRRLVVSALPALGRLRDPLPEAVRERLGVAPLAVLLAAAHGAGAGDAAAAAEAARRRLALDELVALAGRARLARLGRGGPAAPRCRVDAAIRARARAALPFRLTPGQRAALGEIVADMGGDRPMARLLQGDVGSGKTVVAALAALVAVANGLQVAVMAPTELLARQHLATLRRLLEPAGVKVLGLTAATDAAAREEARRRLAAGEPAVAVGTQALLRPTVTLPRLGLVVIDEQHRFGVSHRAALVGKGRSPHLLVMSATPIPRTLALLVHADLDLSTIPDRPPGRRPPRTVARPEGARGRVQRFVARRLARGERAVVVFPRIEPGPEGGGPALVEWEDRYRAAFRGFRCELVHGRMEAGEREAAMDRFRRGVAQVLLATTVVEVGMDVPEATVMVVEGAERFGLAQLHQLRGRVGRSGGAAWCVLLATEGAGERAWRRLRLLERCHDGFELAERDLAQRGPGEPGGVRQWGAAGLRFGGPLDAALLADVRAAVELLEAGGELEAAVATLERFYRFGHRQEALAAG